MEQSFSSVTRNKINPELWLAQVWPIQYDINWRELKTNQQFYVKPTAKTD